MTAWKALNIVAFGCALTLVLGNTCVLWSARAAENTSVSLAWDPNPESDIAGYMVYCGTSSESRSIAIDARQATNTAVFGLNPGGVYFFVATAYNQKGYESDCSNEVSTRIAVPPDEHEDPLNFFSKICFEGLMNTSVTLPTVIWEDGRTPKRYQEILVPQHGYLDGQWSGLTYRPDPDYYGPEYFKIKVVFPDDSVQELEYEGIIHAYNSPPTAANTCIRLDQSTIGQDLYQLALGGWDPERKKLKARITQRPAFGEIVGTMPHMYYRPNPDFPGHDWFVFVLSDGLTESAPAWCQVVSSSSKATRKSVQFQVSSEASYRLKTDIIGEETESTTLLLAKSSDLQHWEIAASASPEQPLRYSELVSFTDTPRFYRFQLPSSFAITNATLNARFRPGQGQDAIGFLLKQIRPGYQMVVNPFLPIENDFPWDVVQGDRSDLVCYRLVDGKPVINDLNAKSPAWARWILPPGEAVCIWNSSDQDAWIVFWGHIEKNSRTNALTSGFNFQASPFPITGRLDTDLKFPAEQGDQVFIVDSASQTKKRSVFRESGWDPVPILQVGDAFVLVTARPRNWIQQWD